MKIFEFDGIFVLNVEMSIVVFELFLVIVLIVFWIVVDNCLVEKCCLKLDLDVFCNVVSI